MTRSEYGQVYDWIAAHPDGVKPGDVCRHVRAHHGRKVTNPDAYLTIMEHHGYLLSESEGRIYAWLAY
jgi:hypothetical protein